MDGKSQNTLHDQLAKLKEAFPEVVSENGIDWEKLKLTLGDDIALTNERYVLNWQDLSPRHKKRVALSVVAWGATIVAVSTITIAQITKAPVDQVLFEVVSGFATVGLSTGLTTELPDPAVYVLAVTMFMGRVGTVTLAAAVAASSRSQLYSMPVERPIVG